MAVSWLGPVFLELGYAEPQGFAKGRQGFRETKMRNGWRIVFVV